MGIDGIDDFVLCQNWCQFFGDLLNGFRNGVDVGQVLDIGFGVDFGELCFEIFMFLKIEFGCFLNL